MRINLSRTELCSGAGACHGWRFEPPGSPRHPCFVSDLSALSPPPWKKARDRLQSLLNSSFNFHLRYPPLGSHRMPPLAYFVTPVEERARPSKPKRSGGPIHIGRSSDQVMIGFRLARRNDDGQKQQKRPPLKSMWLSFCSGHSLSYSAYRIGGLSFPPVIDTPLACEGSKTRDKLYESRYVRMVVLNCPENAEINRGAVVGD